MKQNSGLHVSGGLIIFSEVFNVYMEPSIPLTMIPTNRTYMLIENRTGVGRDVMGEPIECAQCAFPLGWRVNNGMYYVLKENVT